MSWIVFAVVVVPLLGFLVWLMLEGSVVRIAPGEVGLVLVRGVATDRALVPGRHYVPALRQITVASYPSRDLVYVAALAGPPTPAGQERHGPAPRVTLGDRAAVRTAYVVRCTITRDRLRDVHERFGPDDLWSAVRDRAEGALRTAVADPVVSLADLAGPARVGLDARVRDAVTDALAEAGFTLTFFALGDLDAGRADDVAQATALAPLEQDHEAAVAPLREAQARNDARLDALGLGSPPALRYREMEVWREFLAVIGRDALAGRSAPPTEGGQADERR